MAVIHRKQFRPFNRKAATFIGPARPAEPTVAVRPAPVTITGVQPKAVTWCPSTLDTERMIACVNAFCAAHNITLPRGEWWYPITRREGEIRGIPTMRGTPRITNGIMAWFVRQNGSAFEAHIANFVEDRAERQTPTARASKLVKLFLGL